MKGGGLGIILRMAVSFGPLIEELHLDEKRRER